MRGNVAIIGEMRSGRVKMRVLALLLAVAVELLLLRLGVWQLQRGREKEAQLRAVAAVLAEKRAVPLSNALAGPEAYQWIAAELRFLPEPLLLLDNQRRGERVGVSVFQQAVAGDGTALLVDLGWLPVSGDRQLPKPAALSGTHRVQGLLLPPPSAGLAIGPAYSVQADGSWLLTRIDRDALAAGLKHALAARVLRPDPAERIGFARDLQVQANTLPPEKHRGYALQWFGLAAAFAVLCIGFWRRKENAGG